MLTFLIRTTIVVGILVGLATAALISNGDMRPNWQGSDREPALLLTDDAKRMVKAYEEFAPGLRIGFDALKKSRISVSQLDKSAEPGGAIHIYRVDVEDPDESSWITVERSIDSLQKFNLTFRLTARANQLATVDVVLFIPRSGKADERIPLGSAVIQHSFATYYFEKSLDLTYLPDLSDAKSPRIVALLPIRAGLVVDLAQFDATLVASERLTSASQSQ